MARWLERSRAAYRLAVSARAPGRLAFREALSRLDANRVRLHFSDTHGRMDLAAEIGPLNRVDISTCAGPALVQDARCAARARLARTRGARGAVQCRHGAGRYRFEVTLRRSE